MSRPDILYWTNKLLIVSVLVLWVCTSFAQSGFNFSQITTSEGLSSNSINAIIQDRNGFIWFGTTNGLNRFDGTNIVIYRNRPDDSSSVPGNDIQALFRDKQNYLWIGTSNGLCYYDELKDVFVVAKKFIGSSVRSICSDYKGNLWIGTYTSLLILNPKANTIREFSTPREVRKVENVWPIISLFEDKLHRMWIGSRSGLYCYDPQLGRLKSFVHDKTNSKSLSNNNVTGIIQDSADRLWFSTLNGLNLLKSDDTFEIFRESPSGEMVNGDIIHSAAETPDHRQLWLATEDGLRIFDFHTKTSTTVRSDPRNIFGLRYNEVQTLYISKEGIFWIGLSRGGVNKFDKNLVLLNFQLSSSFEPKVFSYPIVTSFAPYTRDKIIIGTIGSGLQLFNTNSRISTSLNFNFPVNVLSLKKLRNGFLWIGTREDGIFQYDPKTKKSQQILSEIDEKSKNESAIRCIEENLDGKVWIGTNGQGIKIFDPRNKNWIRYPSVNDNANIPSLPINGYIRAIAQKKNGDVWIGSYGTGLAVFHSGTNKFTHYSKTKNNLANDYVLCLLHDRNQQTWIGTNSGLTVFNETTKQFKTFSEANGFSRQTTIYKILEDNKGKLWLSTSNGISSYDPLTRKFENYTAVNGVSKTPFYEGSGAVSLAGEIFLGGESGFNYFEPSEMPVATRMPNVILTELKVSNEKVLAGEKSPLRQQINFAKEINLRYGESFSIGYAAMDYTNASRNQYAHKLEGLDNSWNNVGGIKNVSYTNLDPGNYVFRVRASIDGRNWGTGEKVIRINILPPWWRSTYAFIIYGLIIVSILYFHRRNSIQKLKIQFELQEEKARAKEAIVRERLESERLRALDNLKIKFLTNLSHDFRTPISLILGPVDKLLSYPDPAVSTETNIIQRNTRRLLNLVNQLLDFRKMEEQELKLNLKPGDLVSSCREASEAFKDIAEQKRIHFFFSSEVEKLPAQFDHDKIERVIFNLLSNAFKFTLAGGEVSVRFYLTEKRNQEENIVVLEIIDTGIGIAPDQLEKIFDPFFQHDTKAADAASGSGIGLSIVSEFVRMHNGKISLDSRLGEGSTFRIEMPVIPVSFGTVLITPQMANSAIDDPVELIENQLPTKSSTDLPVLLIVDDDEDIRFYLKDNLKAHYKIIEAADGRDGWKKMISQHPQLVVSDISMPLMSGIELTKKIKGDKRTCHIPIILLTGLSDEQQQVEGLESGANDYLTKPFNFEILNVKIKNLLIVNQTLKNSFVKKVQLIDRAEAIESVDVKLLRKINQHIKDNLSNTGLSVEDISAHVGMSRGTLYRKMLELTEMSPVEYIRSIKLDYAASLLAQSDLNVSQIAYMTGFANPNYFAKIFRLKYQMSPKEYIMWVKKNQQNDMLK